jgi:hypothetical protein
MQMDGPGVYNIGNVRLVGIVLYGLHNVDRWAKGYLPLLGTRTSAKYGRADGWAKVSLAPIHMSWPTVHIGNSHVYCVVGTRISGIWGRMNVDGWAKGVLPGMDVASRHV